MRKRFEPSRLAKLQKKLVFCCLLQRISAVYQTRALLNSDMTRCVSQGLRISLFPVYSVSGLIPERSSLAKRLLLLFRYVHLHHAVLLFWEKNGSCNTIFSKAAELPTDILLQWMFLQQETSFIFFSVSCLLLELLLHRHAFRYSLRLYGGGPLFMFLLYFFKLVLLS